MLERETGVNLDIARDVGEESGVWYHVLEVQVGQNRQPTKDKHERLGKEVGIDVQLYWIRSLVRNYYRGLGGPEPDIN